MTKDCPCGSTKPWSSCCQPLHEGAEADTAEALMRSRYAAYAVANVAYLWRTLHVSHVDKQRPERDVLAELRRWCRQARFMGLQVLDAQTADDDGVARVLFHACVFVAGKNKSFMECSRFRHDGVGWRYVDGELDARADLRTLHTIDAFLAR
jgi:SEC-C motif-containing protein